MDVDFVKREKVRKVKRESGFKWIAFKMMKKPTSLHEVYMISDSEHNSVCALQFVFLSRDKFLKIQ